MLKIICPILCLLSIAAHLSAQTIQEDFEKVYNKFINQNTFEELSAEDKNQVKELEKLMSFLHGFTKKEIALNGKVNFGFSGNQNDLRNLVRLNAGINIDHGNYPFQLDFSTSVQTLVNNGSFQENISTIDVSFDYMHHNVGNGLWLENYALLKRFGDDYLGIRQRYEVGLGFILNFRSKKLTEDGDDNYKELQRKPTIKTAGDDLVICYEEICSKVNNPKKLSAEECKIIGTTRRAFTNANRKKYNQLRLALLAGIFYEIDQSDAMNTLVIGGRDSTVVLPFATQSYWRWELRPTLEWQPSDQYTIKIKPYFKMPLTRNNQATVTDGIYSDTRTDYFLDFQSSLTAELSSKIAISVRYRYIYDNAPNRAFIDNGNGSKVLLLGQQSHQVYSMTFEFGF